MTLQDGASRAISFNEIAQALRKLDGKQYHDTDVAFVARQLRDERKRKEKLKRKKEPKSHDTKSARGVRTIGESPKVTVNALTQQKLVTGVDAEAIKSRLKQAIARVLEEARSSFEEPGNPLRNETIAKWFENSLPNVPCRENYISMTGSDPFSEQDFDFLLGSAGLQINDISPHTDVLIVGRSGWEKAAINELLDQRLGQKLRVYSQEMFLAFWASSCDPFEDEIVVKNFGVWHPALEFVSSCWYAWPSTVVSLNSEVGLQLDSYEVGILGYMGYRVGKYGLPVDQRLKILADVFKSHLPPLNSSGYMREWGDPSSLERLKKMADSIAAFCRNEQRAGKFEAASQREHDLQWLKDNFYRGRFQFQWPEARVG
ncbi:MAG: hypothetical protein IAG10_03340 [Planctomycetaceae bacterium]|nr:hypothetical protein [Planctomycetaceae bacterium]